MKVLVLTHRMPFPITDGQSLRIYHYVRHLAERHDFALLTHGAPPYPTALVELFRDVYALPRRAVPVPSSAWRRLVGGLRVDEVFDRDPRVVELIRQALEKEQPDLVWMSGWDMLAYADVCRGYPLLADVVDEGFLEYSRELLASRTLRAAVLNVRRLALSVLFERSYFPRATLCAVVSAVDARWVRRFCPGLAVEVLENGVDHEFFRPLGEPEEYPSLVFEGNMSFPPNVEAATYLVGTLLPRIRRHVPGVRVLIVGRDPAPQVRRLAGSDVVVTGEVPDVRPYLDRASVFVCPMRTGAGIKNKILQAWAMEKAVVATPLAAGGLSVRPDDNIVLAGGTGPLVDRVVALLRDPVRRSQLGRSARATILARYTWAQRSLGLDQVFTQALIAHRGRHAD